MRIDPRDFTSRSLELRASAIPVVAAALGGLFFAAVALGFVVGGRFSEGNAGKTLAFTVARSSPTLRTMLSRLSAVQGAPRSSDEPVAVARARAARLGLGSVASASALLGGAVLPEWSDEARAILHEISGGDASIDSLRWPVDGGWFVRGYGSGEGAYHLAVDMAAPIGTRVRAAAPGIVAYSGNAIRGFGNLLLVVHPNGWVTLYAHNSRHFVEAGAFVSAGQLIAEVGSTGISRGPHVHFELMHQGRNCDPAPLFRPGMPHRGGDLSLTSQAVWQVDEGRPPAIRCDRRRVHPRSARHGGHGDHEHDAAEI